jgi:phosphopantothenoylcysteine decarboxylase/phosphopantothenate--cysteine ligase
MIRSLDAVPGTVDRPLEGKKILLGVSGGIAAYKTPELVRRMRDLGADIRVVMTANAHHFVTPTSLQAVSGQPVRTDLWDHAAEAAMGHIELARWADVLLIAPASADLLARLALGRADDLLTTLRLATRAPVLIAPAMNHVMWLHPATQRNVATLVGDGNTVIPPDSGAQACGETGPGRLPAAETLAAVVLATLQPPRQMLAGRRVLVTAGPTREAIDPVRYVSNHSSGKQGYALARAARRAGANVTLVSGPVTLPEPAGITTIKVTSALDMQRAVQAHATDCDVFIGVAAVADYRPATPADQKIKKLPGRSGELVLTLTENPDIIAGVAALRPRPFVVGFAAETQSALANARDKRLRKGMDLIVVNDVARGDIGFNAAENDVTLIWDAGERHLPKSGKDAISDQIIEQIAALLASESRSTS